MRTSLPCLALTIAGLLLAGCSASAPTSTSPTPSDAFTPAESRVQSQPDGAYSFGAGAWTINIDPVSLSATVEGVAPGRAGQFNGDFFGLPIDQFFGGDALTVTGVTVNGDLDLVLDIAIAHPFAGPTNLEGTASASNRADLGVSGCFFVRGDRPATLVNDELQTNHQGDYQFASSGTIYSMNTKLLENADGFSNPVDSSVQGASFWEEDTNVLHPYIVLVDEADPQCRASTRTGDVITNNDGSGGNYNSETGWSRLNIGSQGEDGVDIQWTGYGVLHQSQTARRQLILDLDELSQITFGGKYALDTCLLAYYTDPRKGENGAQLRANRLPSSSAERFAYRMPFGTNDASQIHQTGNQIIGAGMGSVATISVAIVDEDSGATVNPEFPGGGLQDVPTDSTIAGVFLTVPDLGVTDLAGVYASGTGSVEDPLIYDFSVTNNTGSTGGIDQINHGMVTVVDADEANGTDPIIWLSSSLAPLTGQKHQKSGHVTLLK